MADNLTPAQRSYCMSQVKNKNTDLEAYICEQLRKRGLRFKKHVKDLPGCPDVVFPQQKLAIFLDGDFWHGYRFPSWKHKVAPFWQEKIEKNRRRDRKNFAKLRRMQWRLVRVWGSQIKKDPQGVIEALHKSAVSC